MLHVYQFGYDGCNTHFSRVIHSAVRECLYRN